MGAEASQEAAPLRPQKKKVPSTTKKSGKSQKAVISEDTGAYQSLDEWKEEEAKALIEQKDVENPPIVTDLNSKFSSLREKLGKVDMHIPAMPTLGKIDVPLPTLSSNDMNVHLPTMPSIDGKFSSLNLHFPTTPSSDNKSVEMDNVGEKTATQTNVVVTREDLDLTATEQSIIKERTNLLLTLGSLVLVCYVVVAFIYQPVILLIPEWVKWASLGITLFHILLFSHRIAAFTISLGLRLIARCATCASSGAFNIHIGWISYRGIFDRNELVISNLIFRNPPQYTKTPFFLLIKEVSVAIDMSSIFSLLVRGEPFVIEHIIVNGLELFVERSDNPDIPVLNVFAALGAHNRDKERRMLVEGGKGVFAAIKESILEKLAENHPDNPMLARMVKSLLEEKTATSTTPVDDSTPLEKKKKSTFRLDIGRMLVLDMVVHVLDALAAEHLDAATFAASDIAMKVVNVTRVDLTDEPTVKGGKRVVLLPDQMGDKFGAKFGGDLAASNAGSIIALLSIAAASNTSHSISESFHQMSDKVHHFFSSTAPKSQSVVADNV